MAVLFSSLGDPKLVQLLSEGTVGVLPTDTVYGLVCRAADEAAVGRLYGLKKRENKPGTLVAASLEQLIELGIKARYLKAVEHFWPGAVSVVIPSHDLGYIHLGSGGIAVRVIANANFLQLVKKTGPLLTTSANPPGQPPANTISEARNYFGDQVDFYMDGGDLSDREPSTLIRIVDDAVEVLREGAVKIDESTGKIL